jgi:hypothetical protein
MREHFEGQISLPLFETKKAEENRLQNTMRNAINAALETHRGINVVDTYRGFEVARKSGIGFQIFERGKLIDDAHSESRAYDKIDALIAKRAEEDRAEAERTYRR